MVEMPSIWCKRSPGAKKSEAGPYAFIDAMTGGNDKSVRSVKEMFQFKLTDCIVPMF